VSKLARNLKRKRKEKDLTQEALAHKAGLTVNGYRGIELGKTDPRASTVARLAKALDCCPCELMGFPCSIHKRTLK